MWIILESYHSWFGWNDLTEAECDSIFTIFSRTGNGRYEKKGNFNKGRKWQQHAGAQHEKYQPVGLRYPPNAIFKIKSDMENLFCMHNLGTYTGYHAICQKWGKR